MGGEKDAVPSPHGSRENGGVWEMGGWGSGCRSRRISLELMRIFSSHSLLL